MTRNNNNNNTNHQDMRRVSERHVPEGAERVRARPSAGQLSARQREPPGDRVRRLHQGQVRARNMQVLPSARASRRPAQEAEDHQQRSGGRGCRSRRRVGILHRHFLAHNDRHTGTNVHHGQLLLSNTLGGGGQLLALQSKPFGVAAQRQSVHAHLSAPVLPAAAAAAQERSGRRVLSIRWRQSSALFESSDVEHAQHEQAGRCKQVWHGVVVVYWQELRHSAESNDEQCQPAARPPSPPTATATATTTTTAKSQFALLVNCRQQQQQQWQPTK